MRRDCENFQCFCTFLVRELRFWSLLGEIFCAERGRLLCVFKDFQFNLDLCNSRKVLAPPALAVLNGHLAARDAPKMSVHERCVVMFFCKGSCTCLGAALLYRIAAEMFHEC